jgi:hypothetical protein
MADETKSGADEIVFRPGEDSRKLALARTTTNETTGPLRPIQGTVMIKAISAIAAAAFIAAALTVLPGFAPEVAASVPQALAKGDRLEIRTAKDCSQQSWPNFEASCLRTVGSKPVKEVRLVTADRTP